MKNKYINLTWMTQKTIKIFIDEIYPKPPRKNYAVNKTNVYHINNVWSCDILDPKEYGSETNRGYRYALVVIDNFSKFRRTVHLKKKNAHTVKDSFENTLIISKANPKLIETDKGKEF